MIQDCFIFKFQFFYLAALTNMNYNNISGEGISRELIYWTFESLFNIISMYIVFLPQTYFFFVDSILCDNGNTQLISNMYHQLENYHKSNVSRVVEAD